MVRSIVVAGVVLASLLAACGDPVDDPAAAPAPVIETPRDRSVDDGPGDLPRPTRPPRRVPPESIVPVEPEPEPGAPIRGIPIVERAVADLADRLGVTAEDVVVVSVEEVTWRDGAAGCPQPGMAYIQVLTNGSRIRLSVGGAVYQYHTRGSGDPFYCANPQEPLTTGPGFGDT